MKAMLKQPKIINLFDFKLPCFVESIEQWALWHVNAKKNTVWAARCIHVVGCFGIFFLSAVVGNAVRFFWAFFFSNKTTWKPREMYSMQYWKYQRFILYERARETLHQILTWGVCTSCSNCSSFFPFANVNTKRTLFYALCFMGFLFVSSYFIFLLFCRAHKPRKNSPYTRNGWNEITKTNPILLFFPAFSYSPFTFWPDEKASLG